MSVLRALLRRVLTYFSHMPLSGMIGAGVLFALSLAPSLIPRNAVVQGILSGLTAAVGFWLGLALTWLWTFLGLAVPTGRVRKAIAWAASALTLALVAYSLWRGAEWQDSLREFLGLERLESVFTPIVLLVAIPVALLLREIDGFSPDRDNDFAPA